MSARRRPRRRGTTPKHKAAAGDGRDGAAAASGGGGSPARSQHRRGSDSSSSGSGSGRSGNSGSSTHRPPTRGVVRGFLHRVSGFLRHAAMHPRDSLALLWAAVVVMLVVLVSARLQEVVDVQQWTVEEVQEWFDMRRDGEWRAHAAAFSGLDGANVAAMTKEDFENKLALTGDAIFNDWRLYVAAHSAWGAAAATLQQPWVVALVVVVAIVSAWPILKWAAAEVGVFEAWRVLKWAVRDGVVFEVRHDITDFVRSLGCEPKSRGDAKYLRLRGFVTMWNKFIPTTTDVFLRPCYAPLLEELRSRTADFAWVTNKPWQLIVGTPGTGKSYFRVVLARDLLFGANGSSQAENKTVHVVLVKCSDKDKALSRANSGGIVLTRRAEGALVGGQLSRATIGAWCGSRVRDGERVVVVVDISHGVMDLQIEADGVEVVMLSANHERLMGALNEANKPSGDRATMIDGSSVELVEGVQTVVMPLWSIAEALQCRDVVGSRLSTEDIVANVLKYGRTGRDALRTANSEKELLDRLNLKESAVFGGNASLTRLLNSGDRMWHRLAQDRLFHRETGYDRAVAAGEQTPAGENLFSQVSVEWRSAYVRDLVVGYSLTQAATAVLSAMADPPRESGVVGSYVEGAYLRILRMPRGSNVVPHFSFGILIAGHKDCGLSRVSAGLLEGLAVQPESMWFVRGDEEAVLRDGVARIEATGATDSGAAVLLQPYDTRYPAIDAVLVVKHDDTLYLLLLQATVAYRQPTGASAGDTLQLWVDLATDSDARFGLVFVLPPKHYMVYSEQDVDHDVDKVLGQYKMCVTTSDL